MVGKGCVREWFESGEKRCERGSGCERDVGGEG